MNSQVSGVLKTLALLCWPILLVIGLAAGTLWLVDNSGLPGKLMMPIYPAREANLSIGLVRNGQFKPYLQIVDPAQPRIGVGDLGGKGPQHDLDIRSDKIHIQANTGERTFELSLPEEVNLVFAGEEPMTVNLKEFIVTTREKATVENLLSEVEQLRDSLAASKDEVKKLEDELQALSDRNEDVREMAAQALGDAEKAYTHATVIGNKGIGLANKAQKAAETGQAMAAAAQKTGDKGVALANKAQQSANKGIADADKAYRSVAALKRYVDHRNQEIQQNLNNHYRSNRPGGKELEFGNPGNQ